MDCVNCRCCQTIVSDCSFVASLAISAQYERRFNKKLITRFCVSTYVLFAADCAKGFVKSVS